MFGYTFIIGMLIMFDQFFKIWAFSATANGPFNIIPGLFYINYIQNTGAAFSILEGRRWFLVLVTAVFLAILGFLLYAGKLHGDTLVSGVCLILAGGTSNLIDRLIRGHVIDYFDFSAIFNFPVFNMADVCVVLGTGMLLYYALIIEPRERKAAQEKAGTEGEA